TTEMTKPWIPRRQRACVPSAGDKLAETVISNTVEGTTDTGERSKFEKQSHPDSIGPFHVLEMLGEGGMGAVYLAEQTDPIKRTVAIKLVHSSLRNSSAEARFEAERQAMARLSHPNVAQIFEAGTTNDGFPYFAMEHVPGDTLTLHCENNRLTIEERLRLFMRVCDGVRHAHQKGVLHRDLKPSNLLVAEIEGEPVPKVIDFGIAKALDEPLTENAELTGLRAIGTPAYMSPEARSGSTDVDTRTDVYSLGVVLYELLAGVRPHQLEKGELLSRFEATALPAKAKPPSTRISSLEGVSANTVAANRRLEPAELARRVRGDLDWIVMKAIDDEPDRRYASAAELAADIERHLEHEPVLASPPSVGYRTAKFVRRHRVAVAATAVVALSLVLGIVGTSIAMVRAQRAEKAAVAQTRRAEEISGFLTGLFEVADPGEARGNVVTARELLDRGAQRIGRELGNEPLLKAQMLHTMSEVYTNLGLYDNAVALEDEALGLRENELGAGEPDTAESADALGTLYRLQGRFEEAEPLHRRALEIREKTFGADHPDVALSLKNLAVVTYILGDAREAELLYDRALAIREAALGPDHADVAESLAHLGWLYMNEERYEEAEKALTRCLSIREETLGADHFLVAETNESIAELFLRTGSFAESEAALLRALSIKQQVFEPGHPEIGETYISLGALYRFQGRPDDAEQSLTWGLDVL
ncbi:MAG: serine/threonine protein kinase, partial [Acidobacteria bacterium]|nr:serine/threonine protein kinase [Candidatus Sulfomarinibacter kjeldsenii]